MEKNKLNFLKIAALVGVIAGTIGLGKFLESHNYGKHASRAEKIIQKTNNLEKIAVENKPTRHYTNQIDMGAEPTSALEKTAWNMARNFLAKINGSELGISTHGNPQYPSPRSNMGTIAYVETSDSHIGMHYSKTDLGAVHSFRKKGVDENGAHRNPDSGLENPTDIQLWSNTNLYPIKTSVEELAPKVDSLLQSIDIVGTNVYYLNEAIQKQSGGHLLPFAQYSFRNRASPKELPGERNVDEIVFVVRNGGNDLRKGQGEVVKFVDNGYNFRTIEMPKPMLPKEINGLKNLK